MPRPLPSPPQLETVCQAIRCGDELTVEKEWSSLGVLTQLSSTDRITVCQLVGRHACQVALADLLNDHQPFSQEWDVAVKVTLVAALMAHQEEVATRVVTHLKQHPSRGSTLNHALARARDENSELALCWLLKAGAHPKLSCGGTSSLLGWAAYRGHAHLVEALISLGNPWADGCHALGQAVQGPHRTMWERLAQVADPNALALALPHAAQSGNVAALDFLLEACQRFPTLPTTEALQKGLMLASQQGHLTVVQRLLPLVSLDHEKGVCLQEALKADHVTIARLLIPRSEVDALHEQWIRARPVQWDLLNKLIPLLEPEVGRQWVKQHTTSAHKLAASEAHLRAQDAQAQPPPDRPRMRRRS